MMTTRRQRNTQQRANNIARRQIFQAPNRISFESIRVPGWRDPQAVLQTVLFTQKVELTVTVAPAKTTAITSGLISSGMLGGSAAYDRIRILSVECWGTDGPVVGQSSDITVALLPIGQSTERATFTDYGTSGAQRAHIRVRPSTLYQMTWVNAGDTTSVIGLSSNVGGTTTVNTVVLQVTVEGRSNTLTKINVPPPA